MSIRRCNRFMYSRKSLNNVPPGMALTMTWIRTRNSDKFLARYPVRFLFTSPKRKSPRVLSRVNRVNEGPFSSHWGRGSWLTLLQCAFEQELRRISFIHCPYLEPTEMASVMVHHIPLRSTWCGTLRFLEMFLLLAIVILSEFREKWWIKSSSTD
jgi:hypothetical protein